MKNKQQLINNIIGQLNGVNKMINEEKDCFQTIIQVKAAKSALASFMNKYIEEQYTRCLTGCKKKSDEIKLKKLIIELTK